MKLNWILIAAAAGTLASCKSKPTVVAAPEAAPEPVPSQAATPAPAVNPPTAPEKPAEPVPAQPASPTDKLEVGSEPPLAPVQAATWIQGEAPASFEPGKLYIFECWATWCGPCIRAIPHVNELHKKYHERGLRVFGMNVWEDGQEKVADFVKKKGDGMSYPVAYTGKGSEFEKQWLKPAGVRGIPHAFVVQDGRIILMSHPMSITEELIEDLLAGGEKAKQTLERLNQRSRTESRSTKLMTDFREALGKKDAAAMEKAISEIEKNDPKNLYLPAMKAEVVIARGEWEKVSKIIEEAAKDPGQSITITMLSNKFGFSDAATDCPKEVLASLGGTMAARLEGSSRQLPNEWLALSRIQWLADEKEKSLASAEKACEVASGGGVRGAFPVKPLESHRDALKEGRLPTMKEFSDWMGEARAKPKAPDAVPAPEPAQPE